MAGLLCVLIVCACSPVVPVDDVNSPVRTITVNGSPLSYVEQGHGDLVVLVHGTAADYRAFARLLPHLGSGFRFVAYSRRHHWPNAWPDDGESYTMSQHVDDLVGVIRTLGGKDAHVVAFSLGARVAANAAVRHPDRIRTLTLSDGLLAPPRTEEAKREMQRLDEQFERLFARVRDDDFEGAVAAYVDVASPPNGWAGLTSAWRRIYLDNARTLALAVKDRTLRPPSCEALGKLTMPVLVISGERAPLALKATNDALVDCLAKGAGRAEVPAAAHYWYEDNPGDGARMLLRLLGGARR